jgi:hypothetical protein
LREKNCLGYASAKRPQTTCRGIFPSSFPVNVSPLEVKVYGVLLLDGDVYINRGCDSEKHAKEIKKMSDDRLQRRLQKDDILVVPAAFDMVSARIFEKEGFEAVYFSGLEQSASHPGLPDAYKVPGRPVEAYRRFYVDDRRHSVKWKRRRPPKWFTDGVKAEKGK